MNGDGFDVCVKGGHVVQLFYKHANKGVGDSFVDFSFWFAISR